MIYLNQRRCLSRRFEGISHYREGSHQHSRSMVDWIRPTRTVGLITEKQKELSIRAKRCGRLCIEQLNRKHYNCQISMDRKWKRIAKLSQHWTVFKWMKLLKIAWTFYNRAYITVIFMKNNNHQPCTLVLFSHLYPFIHLHSAHRISSHHRGIQYRIAINI